MPAENLAVPPASGNPTPATASRHLLRTAIKGALATIDQRMGHPFASLVLLATDPDGSPLLLLSKLALHTQNLAKDPRAGVLIDGTAGLGDPLTGGRVTISGEARPTSKASSKARFLARHPSAAGYADFPDFAMFRLEVAAGHYIGGFGRIVSLSPAELLTDVAGAAALVEAEPGIIEHMNSDHADAVALYASELAGCPPGDWHMCGIDPAGIDLLHCSNTARVDFPRPVQTAQEARVALIELVKQARARRNPAPVNS
jgi:putative heme iron utilization protein